MTGRPQYFILLILSLVMLLSGCEKDLYLEGDIVGFIDLIDNSSLSEEDPSGVEVFIMDTDFKARTDEDGRYEFKNVPAGTYHFIYYKDGYGEGKQYNYQFIGGDIPGSPDQQSLYQIPLMELKDIDFIYEDRGIEVSVTLSDTTPSQLIMYLGDSTDVSYLNYDLYSTFGYSQSYEEIVFSELINYQNVPYAKGESFYLILCTANQSEYVYRDYEKGVNVYSTARQISNFIKLTIP